MNTPTIQYFKPSDTVVSKFNVRPAKQVDGIEGLANDIAHNGQLQPVVIRMEDETPAVVAGQRRRKALLKLAQANDDVVLAGIVVDIDDAQATAISLSENEQQSPMTPMDSYRAFAKLVKQGWDTKTIAEVYSMSELQVRQTLAIGSLPLAVCKAYEAEDIDEACLRVLAIGDKARVRKWVELHKKGEAPTWSREIRSFLVNSKSEIRTSMALFDVSEAKIAIVEDFFQDENFFADSDEFWQLQNAEIEKQQADFEAKGWTVEVLHQPFYNWEYVDVTKAKGGKVYIFVTDSGEVTVKNGILTSTAYRALERKEAGQGSTTAEKPTEKPEVTKKMNEYLLGYLTQSAQSAVIDDYDLTQRVMLVMLLTQDGALGFSYDEQLSRVNSEITGGELFATEKHVESDTFAKSALKAVGTKPSESHYLRSFEKLFTKVMKLEIDVVQRAIQAVLASTITLNSNATKAINKQLNPDMSQFWQADRSGAFFDTLSGKRLLLSVLETVTDKKIASAHANSKVSEIRDLVKTKASEQKGWTPKYLSGGSYGNGSGAPLK